MKIEWQTTLIQRYPLFFRKPTELSEVEVAALDEEIHDDGPVDAWGIECGDGWFGILDGLISQFEQHIQVLKANGVGKIDQSPESPPIQETKVPASFRGRRLFAEQSEHGFAVRTLAACFSWRPNENKMAFRLAHLSPPQFPRLRGRSWTGEPRPRFQW